MKTLEGFAMCVLDSFKAAVAQHNFQPGDTLYDTPKAYSVWHTALQHIGFCLQVDSAIRARMSLYGNHGIKLTANACIALCSSTNAVSISSARTMKRFP